MTALLSLPQVETGPARKPDTRDLLPLERVRLHPGQLLGRQGLAGPGSRPAGAGRLPRPHPTLAPVRRWRGRRRSAVRGLALHRVLRPGGRQGPGRPHPVPVAAAAASWARCSRRTPAPALSASSGRTAASARPGASRAKVGTRRRFPQASGDLRVRWCSAVLKIDVMALALNNDPAFRSGKLPGSDRRAARGVGQPSDLRRAGAASLRLRTAAG